MRMIKEKSQYNLIARIPNQKGLSLLEVLVAVLLFSIGVLSVSSTQLVGLKASSGSGSKNQAQFLAADAIERIRANRLNAANYVTSLSSAAPTTQSTVAQMDLADWKSQISSLLPNGQGSIELLDNQVTITLTWSSKIYDKTQTQVTETLTMSAEL
jgi:type IV pilus assembly protein PilV